MTVHPIHPYLQPLHKSVRVRTTVGETFALFTEGIGRWWPLAQYSIGQSRSRTCGIEPRVGGEVFELLDDGERHVWGTVLAWEPPRRFVMTWHPGREAGSAQEVEVRFTADADGTRVDLEHRNWQAFGENAAEAREGYEEGWTPVLRRFTELCDTAAPSRT